MSKRPRASLKRLPLAIETNANIKKNNDYNGYQALNKQHPLTHNKTQKSQTQKKWEKKKILIS